MTSQVQPTVTTIANRHGREQILAWVIMLGVGVVVLLGANSLSPPARVTCLAVAVFGSIWPVYRLWLMGMRFDDRGVTVRKFLGTDRFGWPDVRRFEYRRFLTEHGWSWHLKIVLRDGRVITTYLGTLKETASPKALIAIRQTAARHEIPTELHRVLTSPCKGTPPFPPPGNWGRLLGSIRG
jgi:hypothetical protein